MPLTGENRVIVRHGLKGLGRRAQSGVARALLAATGFAGKIPTATEVGFPDRAGDQRVSGRMESAGQAVRMFLTVDPDEAASIAAEPLVTLNRERQTAEQTLLSTRSWRVVWRSQ